jgi:hypothetical protein
VETWGLALGQNAIHHRHRCSCAGGGKEPRRHQSGQTSPSNVRTAGQVWKREWNSFSMFACHTDATLMHPACSLPDHHMHAGEQHACR